MRKYRPWEKRRKIFLTRAREIRCKNLKKMFGKMLWLSNESYGTDLSCGWVTRWKKTRNAKKACLHLKLFHVKGSGDVQRVSFLTQETLNRNCNLSCYNQCHNFSQWAIPYWEIVITQLDCNCHMASIPHNCSNTECISSVIHKHSMRQAYAYLKWNHWKWVQVNISYPSGRPCRNRIGRACMSLLAAAAILSI